MQLLIQRPLVPAGELELSFSRRISYIVLVRALCALIIYCIPGGKHAADASM